MLFLGMTAWTAATLVPARATRSARQATTIAGDGLSRRRRVIKRDLLWAFGWFSLALTSAVFVLLDPGRPKRRGRS
jgi:hypothetical protein